MSTLPEQLPSGRKRIPAPLHFRTDIQKDAYTLSLERQVQDLKQALKRERWSSQAVTHGSVTSSGSITLREVRCLEIAMKRQGVKIDTAKGLAFLAGWLYGCKAASLQVPLLLEDQGMRDHFCAGFYGRRGSRK